MQLSKYISELLYRYDCVMVPGFGGFVSNTVSSELNAENHQFTPPTKHVSFNVNLQQNDGLLTNHIATSLQISFDEATKIIAQEVLAWQNDIQKAPLLLQNIGQFTLEEDQLVFEPIAKINYLTSSFGLSDVDANYVLRQNVTPVEEVVIESSKSYRKYVAVAAVALGLFIGGSTYVSRVQTEQELAAQETINTQIQQASFNILKPLPSVTLTVEKENVESLEVVKKYHVVAGAYKEAANADKKVALLKRKGFNARIIGVNKWGLTQVVYESYASRRQAINALNKVKKEDNKYAWLLVNE